MLIFQLECRSKAQNVGNQTDYVDVGLNFWALIQYKLIKMSSYQYRKSVCGDKVVRSSYLHIVISFTGKMSSLYWIRALVKKARMDLKRGDRNFPCRILKKKKKDDSASPWDPCWPIYLQTKPSLKLLDCGRKNQIYIHIDTYFANQNSDHDDKSTL